MGDPLPAPKNRFVEVTKIVLEKLIEGVGVDVAVAAAVAYEPWLASPFVNYIFKWAVGKAAAYLDENMYDMAIKIIVRAQSSKNKAIYNDALKPIIEGSPTDAEIQAARDAADHLIERNRP